MKLRSRPKAYMIVDHEMERSTLWCLCGRTYVFNGTYTGAVSSISGQVSCACYGDGLELFSRTAKVVSIQANSFTANGAAPIDVAISQQTDHAPYSISRKTLTLNYSYVKTNRKLEESVLTSGFTVKAVPGQVPKILKWQRGATKDDVKTVTYMGGSTALNHEFVQQAWLHLRPASEDGYTRAPGNGVELMYFLAFPACTRNGELDSISARFARRMNGSTGISHLNPDAHLLNTLVTKGDVLDHTQLQDFLNMVTGIQGTADLNVAILRSTMSWPTLHFLSFALKEDPAQLLRGIELLGDQWSFYDAMLSDRIMSNYMDDLWSLFKWLKSKLIPEKINQSFLEIGAANNVNSHVRAETSRLLVSRRIYDVLATYRKLSNKGYEYLDGIVINLDGTTLIWNQIEQHVVAAYRLSNEGELANAGQGPTAPKTRSRGRISSSGVGRPTRRRTH